MAGFDTLKKSLSIQPHPHLLPPVWPRPEDGIEGDEPPFDWAALVPRVVHPAKVAIVEALIRIGRPLSATELRDLFNEPGYYLSLVSYHARELEKVGVIEEIGSRQVRGATEKFYFFPLPPNGKPAS